MPKYAMQCLNFKKTVKIGSNLLPSVLGELGILTFVCLIVVCPQILDDNFWMIFMLMVFIRPQKLKIFWLYIGMTLASSLSEDISLSHYNFSISK